MSQAKFQTFDETGDSKASGQRLAALRAELKKRGLSGFILPRADAQQNEYVPPSEERLAWLTGFTGSAGAAIVLADRAILFVDGRYTLQAREQVDTSLFTVEHLVETPPAVSRLWNASPLPGETSISACADPADNVSRIITPAFTQACRFSTDATRAITSASPLIGCHTKWNASAEFQMSTPSPATVNVLPDVDALPATPTAKSNSRL